MVERTEMWRVALAEAGMPVAADGAAREICARGGEENRFRSVNQEANYSRSLPCKSGKHYARGTRTDDVLSVENLLARNLGMRANAAGIRKMKDEEVDTLEGDPNRAMAIKSTLAVIRGIDVEIAKVEREVLKQVAPDPQFDLLSEVPGIGKILAMTIVLETGDIKRFPSVGNYASYCRRVKSTKLTNNKKKGENNRKNGNSHLAWAYGEAAMQAILNAPAIKTFYERKRAKTNVPSAMNAVGHKLARAFYHVMRTGKAFEMKRAFGRER